MNMATRQVETFRTNVPPTNKERLRRWKVKMDILKAQKAARGEK